MDIRSKFDDAGRWSRIVEGVRSGKQVRADSSGTGERQPRRGFSFSFPFLFFFSFLLGLEGVGRSGTVAGGCLDGFRMERLNFFLQHCKLPVK